jgi:hypothetical protein
MTFKQKIKIYIKEFKNSRVAWVGAFFGFLEVVATQVEYVREIIGDKLTPFVMIACFYIARFRPAKVLPRKEEEGE